MYLKLRQFTMFVLQERQNGIFSLVAGAQPVPVNKKVVKMPGNIRDTEVLVRSKELAAAAVMPETAVPTSLSLLPGIRVTLFHCWQKPTVGHKPHALQSDLGVP